jgi:serine/threonine protein kinase
MVIGDIVSHYKILEKIGEGGMGEIFLAEDTKLERKVALKFLPRKMSVDKDARKRFEREAKAAAALNHPNIVTIYEIDDIHDRVYIAMEYVEEKTLREMIRQKTLLEIMPVEGLIDIAVQVCEGLEQAHGAGIIHRDIKLQNIMLDKNNRVKILDFGLAKLKGASKITGDLSRVGTIHYMSPEQAQGEEVDLRTDIWSLGVVLYELVTGQPLFKGELEQVVIRSIISGSPQPPTEICDSLPKGLEKIIMKCLCRYADDRYSSAQSLASALKELKKSLKGEKQDPGIKQEEKSAAPKEAERRQATVVFAEIIGYNRMLKKSDVEEVATIMNDCLEMLGSIVKKYDGTVDGIMETGLTAFYGIPSAVEGAPEKAVSTAIQMRRQVYAFNREKKIPVALDIRVGINTGLVISRHIGPDEKNNFSAVGNTVMFARQLKDSAKKGTIYVGPLTYRYTKDRFRYRELNKINLKGKKKFELLSSKEEVDQPEFQSDQMIYSDMVDRDKELDRLKLHLLKVINGEGSIVSIIGEAGMGKSRLITELKKMKEIEKVTLFEGKALSISKKFRYHPIIDILKIWADISEEENETDALIKLERAVYNTCSQGAAEIFPFAAALMGMKPVGKHAERIQGIEDREMKKLIMKYMRELMVKSAEQHPLVFIIENLHWADISSIQLLESFFRLAEKHPIFFINALRPGYKETGDHAVKTADLGCSRIHTKIYLQPLETKECEILIRILVRVDHIPPGTAAAITKRTEGNPFFIKEMVQSLLDEGAAKVTGGKFNLTEKFESVTIPKTIQDVLMARIDKLDILTKTLLKEASVIGRCFFHKVLAEVTETPENIDKRLQYLKEAQIIRERTRLGEIEYLFKHPLIREAAYESLLLKKKKYLHLKVAAAIGSVFPGKLSEFYGMLSMHYFRSENPGKAREYLIKAGEEALKPEVSKEAFNYYIDALDLYLVKVGTGKK